jgi:hypothetical protein
MTAGKQIFEDDKQMTEKTYIGGKTLFKSFRLEIAQSTAATSSLSCLLLCYAMPEDAGMHAFVRTHFLKRNTFVKKDKSMF